MNILLGVCGSISAYKAYDIARNLIKDGHNIRVIMTRGAEEFILPKTFSYLGASEVYTSKDDFNPKKKMHNVLHIDLKDWLDVFAIVPASANTIAKLAGGFCDDLLSSVFLTSEQKTKIIFPAMNTQMYLNTITKTNLAKLDSIKNTFIHQPASGELACGEIGIGKLPEVETISEFIQNYNPVINNRKILITTGSTVAPLDTVRYLTNPSSGKTGYELAKAYLKQGADVTLIYGSLSTFPVNSLKEHPKLKLIKVDTTENMFQAVNEHFDHCDVYISSAAVSDIQFEQQPEKIKKSKQGNSIEFKWAKDILGTMLGKKKKQMMISFAAETGNLDENFSNKWKAKPVDLMIGNLVHNGFSGNSKGFGADSNKYFFIKQGEISETQDFTKSQLAHYIRNFTEKQNDKNIL